MRRYLPPPAVEDIRADDITDGDIITASQGSIDADGGLRSTGAHGDDGQTDDDAGNLQDPRQGELPSTKKSAPLSEV